MPHDRFILTVPDQVILLYQVDVGDIVPHLLPQSSKCEYRTIELAEDNLQTMMWKVLDQFGQESTYN